MTAVEWLFHKYKLQDGKLFVDDYDYAREMEKQQMATNSSQPVTDKYKSSNDMRKQIEQIMSKVESGDLAYHDAVDELLLLYNVMHCLPTDTEISIAADEWEKNASCGVFEGGYVNEDFIAGVNWLKSFINKA